MRKFLFILIIPIWVNAQTVTCPPTWASNSFSMKDFYMFYTAVAFCDTHWVKSQFSNSDVYKIYTAQICVCRALDSLGGGGSDSLDWHLFGNSGTDPDTNFIGTTDNQDLTLRSNNIPFTRFKTLSQIKVCQTDSSRYDSTAINTQQVQVGSVFLAVNDTCGNDTHIPTSTADTSALWSCYLSGQMVGDNLINGWGNIWTGVGIAPYARGSWGHAGSNPGTPYGDIFEGIYYGLNIAHRWRRGGENCGFGVMNFYNSDSCQRQNAFGLNALRNTRAMLPNEAFGVNALLSNTTGDGNVAFGSGAGENQTTPGDNTYIGSGAGQANILGFSNFYGGTFSGFLAKGSGNTMLGIQSGVSLTTANECIGIGELALNGITTESMRLGIGHAYYASVTNAASSMRHHLISGIMNSDSSQQEIWLNGKINYLNTGNGTLVAGVDTIFVFGITANSVVQLTFTEASLGVIYEEKANRSANNYFIVKSTDLLDDDDFGWTIFEKQQ